MNDLLANIARRLKLLQFDQPDESGNGGPARYGNHPAAYHTCNAPCGVCGCIEPSITLEGEATKIVEKP